MFRERGKEGERRKRGRETSVCGCLLRTPYWGTWPATQACALTGNRTAGLLGHRPCAQSTELRQPGLDHFILNCRLLSLLPYLIFSPLCYHHLTFYIFCLFIWVYLFICLFIYLPSQKVSLMRTGVFSLVHCYTLST